jgi:hypothetical protein
MTSDANVKKILRENVFTGIHPNEVNFGIKHLQFSLYDNQFVLKNGLLKTSKAPFNVTFQRDEAQEGLKITKLSFLAISANN